MKSYRLFTKMPTKCQEINKTNSKSKVSKIKELPSDEKIPENKVILDEISIPEDKVSTKTSGRKGSKKQKEKQVENSGDIDG